MNTIEGPDTVMVRRWDDTLTPLQYRMGSGPPLLADVLLADFVCAACQHGLAATDEGIGCPNCGSAEVMPRRLLAVQIAEVAEVAEGLPEALRAAMLAAPAADPAWLAPIDERWNPGPPPAGKDWRALRPDLWK